MKTKSFWRRALCTTVLALAAAASFADGLVIINNPPQTIPGHFPFAPLSVSYHRVTVKINGLVATTTVDQEFSNPTNATLEGTYMFPLPEGANIDKFSMDVNGKTLSAELLPADAARSLYEDIVRKMRDPALLEYAGRGAFKVRIYPIEPHSKKRIQIRYTQLLSSDGGLVEYVYPLNTEKFSSTPLSDASVMVSIDGTEPLKSVYCPTHQAEVKRNGERTAVVGWEARNVRPDTDFKVVFSRTPRPMSIDLVTSRISGEDGYFMILASAGVSESSAAAQPKDVCFVMDTSGSMAGAKLEQARQALHQTLAGLSAADRFAIVRFSTEVEPYAGSLTSATASAVSAAGRFIDDLRAMGGTDIDGALRTSLALGADSAKAGRPYYVIFLTDGLPTIGETREDAIMSRVSAAKSAARVFTFGVGTDVNTHLLDRLAGETRAVSRFVLPGEDIELKVAGLAARIKEPVMTGLSLSFSNPSVRLSAMSPAALPDLFNGDMLVVFGRYSGSGTGTLTVSGAMGQQQKKFTVDADFPAAAAGNDFIPRLWAERRVGWLLDQVRLSGESAELRDEIVALARKYGIVTPYTAFLILEDEERRSVPMTIRSFQELSEDKSTLGQAQGMVDSLKREAADEKARSGASAVANATEVRSMKESSSLSQPGRGAGLNKSLPAAAAPSTGYRAEQTQNYATQVRVLEGRAFYQNGPVWTDSTAQGKKNLKQKNIQFGSAEYFTLLAANKEAARWMSLGNNIDFVIGDTMYSVRDN